MEKYVTGMVKFDERTPLKVFNDFRWQLIISEQESAECTDAFIHEVLSGEIIFGGFVTSESVERINLAMTVATPFITQSEFDIYAVVHERHYERVEGE